jgi:hypothetical protein
MSYDNVMTAEEFSSLVKQDPKEILKYMMEIAQASREFPDHALIISFESIPKDAPSNIAIREFGRLFAAARRSGLCRQGKLDEFSEVEERLENWFPNLEEMSFNGYVLAGSAVVLACQVFQNGERSTPSDLDFYPIYDPKDLRKNNKSVQDLIMIPYNKFLEDIENIGASLVTKRNQNCTTVIYNDSMPAQIIHRAHTSERSVVVGFDQMACKAFYDGKMIYFTIDAALCLYFGINPVDWRRESPSHFNRVEKYARYGFTPIFPHLSFSLGKELADDKNKICIFPGGVSLHGYTYYDSSSNAYKAIELSLNVNHAEHESDYDGTSSKGIDLLGHYYHAVCMLITRKFNLFPVFSEKPTETLTNAHFAPIRKVLEKTAGGNKADFYFGDNNTKHISDELARLVIRTNDRGNGKRAYPLTEDQLTRLIELEKEYQQIVVNREEELRMSIPKECYALFKSIDFIVSNPGSQFTASFKPIFREKPEDYWGPSCVPFECHTYYKIKFTLLCCRHRLKSEGKHWFGLFGKDLMQYLFSFIYLSHFRHETKKPVYNNGFQEDVLRVVREDVRVRMPWYDDAPLVLIPEKNPNAKASNPLRRII